MRWMIFTFRVSARPVHGLSRSKRTALIELTNVLSEEGANSFKEARSFSAAKSFCLALIHKFSTARTVSVTKVRGQEKCRSKAAAGFAVPANGYQQK